MCLHGYRDETNFRLKSSNLDGFILFLKMQMTKMGRTYCQLEGTADSTGGLRLRFPLTVEHQNWINSN